MKFIILKVLLLFICLTLLVSLNLKIKNSQNTESERNDENSETTEKNTGTSESEKNLDTSESKIYCSPGKKQSCSRTCTTKCSTTCTCK